MLCLIEFQVWICDTLVFRMQLSIGFWNVGMGRSIWEFRLLSFIPTRRGFPNSHLQIQIQTFFLCFFPSEHLPFLFHPLFYIFFLNIRLFARQDDGISDQNRWFISYVVYYSNGFLHAWVWWCTWAKNPFPLMLGFGEESSKNEASSSSHLWWTYWKYWRWLVAGRYSRALSKYGCHCAPKTFNIYNFMGKTHVPFVAPFHPSFVSLQPSTLCPPHIWFQVGWFLF